MLDHFLDVVLKNETAREQSVKLAHSFRSIPEATLRKLASGELKLSHLDHEHGEEWLEKFKDSPLFEQALALEKAELENEVAQSQAQAAAPQMDHFWRTKDQIRVQKRMLDMQLVEAQMGTQNMQPGGQLPEQNPGETAQGAGALGDVAAEGAQQGEAGKQAAARFAKAAFDIGAVGREALEFAKKNPAAVGAGVGAVGGALAAPKDEKGNKRWLSGALSGGALGAGAGQAISHAAHGISSRMAAGKGIGEAAKGYGADSLTAAGQKMRAMKDAIMEKVHPAQQTLPGM